MRECGIQRYISHAGASVQLITLLLEGCDELGGGSADNLDFNLLSDLATQGLVQRLFEIIVDDKVGRRMM